MRSYFIWFIPQSIDGSCEIKIYLFSTAKQENKRNSLCIFFFHLRLTVKCPENTLSDRYTYNKCLSTCSRTFCMRKDCICEKLNTQLKCLPKRKIQME